MTLSFFKYQGTGNDFIILDNREGKINFLTTEIVEQLCHRKYGIGADGLMLMNSHE
jgi:diaminopimelate epimerase